MNGAQSGLTVGVWLTANSIAAGVQVENDGRGEQAVDAEEVPLAGFEPARKPLQRHEAGEEREDGTEQAGDRGRVQIERRAGCGLGGVRGFKQAAGPRGRSPAG